ncbi:MAG: CHAT domain-containing protein [Terracidiphilus sp.]
MDTYTFARVHGDQFLAASASLNLGWAALQIDHFDEAVEWSQSANRAANNIGAEGLAQLAIGNLGWAYFQLGDDERALERFQEAEKSAAKLGNLRDELKWISDAGYVYHDSGDSTRATQYYRQALYLARQIDSKEDIANALEDLAQVSVEAGRLDEASAYLKQVTPMENTGGNRLSAYLMLTQGMLAAARHEDQQAERLFRGIQSNLVNPTSARLTAGDELAGLLVRQGKTRETERVYKATLTIFESARAQLKREDSRLPFTANAAGIYDHFVHLLVEQGRSEAALALADRSRARMLAQGLGVEAGKAAPSAPLHPRQIAQSSGATLLFYWLGARQSYLWAITPARIALIRLPAQKEIAVRVERYRRDLLDGEDPRQSGNEDGRALYDLLVAPAAKLIRPGAPVMILADGALNQLNFETLLVPGAEPRLTRNENRFIASHPFRKERNAGPSTSLRMTGAPSSQYSMAEAKGASGAGVHYWIEDETLLSAPSLELLAAARPERIGARKLLLLGNPATASAKYPSLPHFGAEMDLIAKHFGGRRAAVFAGQQATPEAYGKANPAQFGYIHFVSHATASRTDPLDSAIILSSGGGENSYKLYAREIMEHPIDARLVTISACNGSGARAYAGEGLVGLSWAFLRAGAHNVIGALWEVSDESTPRLMDTLYQGLQEGRAPATALRQAKLALLNAPGRFHAPYYWAPFQIYTRR